jgi:dihydrodipicolinate synthase
MFKGIYTPMISIFNNDGGLDKESTSALIEKLISDGVDGIVILGTIGEFYNLSHDEKKDYIKFVTETVAGRTKVIAGTSSNNIKEVIDLNKCAKDEGADAVLIVTPYYFSLNEQYVYEYYSTIAKNTELPIILYNFPAKTATNLSDELVFKLATEFENIAGIKDTTDSISNVRKFVEKIKKVRKDFSILSGFDEYLIPNLQVGGDGIIGGLSNINAKLFIDTYKAFIEEDFEKLSTLQKDINKLMKLYDLADPFIVAMKEAVGMTLNLEFNTSLRNYTIKVDETVKKRIMDTINLK